MSDERRLVTVVGSRRRVDLSVPSRPGPLALPPRPFTAVEDRIADLPAADGPGRGTGANAGRIPVGST